MPIKVDESSKLSQALELHPDILEYIVSLNPDSFKNLLNPVMRKVMTPRVSLTHVAEKANVPIMELLERIHEIAQSPLTDAERTELSRRFEE